ncbi:AraC-like DNA-binding protein [Chitinophaga skermanii]|uniref:AraC-like DNA-binding protein n=1 Tax=Chitinophaga skermanii TaxID=331697 RepID=A0A327QQY1_9BACT|nr:AraC family transcriptional regulator [Chitinophaga skermanii]RAJ06651.1 AraC-like DNA-binding protein [Chitinophaga skermanii]
MSALQPSNTTPGKACPFDIKGGEQLKERKRTLTHEGHNGYVHEVSSPDGINLGYYNVKSSQAGKVIFENQQPFIQLSYNLVGNKSYHIDHGRKILAAIEKQQYNYLYLPKEEIQLQWPANEQLEIFELGVSTDLLLNFLPEEHPLFPIFSKSMAYNAPASLSKMNLPLPSTLSTILYDMLNCPLDGRYKQLYLKAKTIELLAIQLTQYEQIIGVPKSEQYSRALKKEDVDRMYHARDIIVGNMNSPCTLIDLAHQVGTNDAYLKSHFKQVFGTTVYGYLQSIKMTHAREMLSQGKSVSEVAYLSGYKHTAHFTRAFKKHFGFAPGIMKK